MKKYQKVSRFATFLDDDNSESGENSDDYNTTIDLISKKKMMA